MQDEAVAFVEQVKDRGDAFREDAASVRVGGTQNMERVATADLPKGPAGPIDFDEIVAGAATNIGAGAGEAPPLILLASLSMPPKALRTLRAEEHTPDLQPLMRISSAAFCSNKKRKLLKHNKQ